MPTDQDIHRRNELYRQAREFLRACLATGSQPYSTIVARAAEAGISLSTLMTTKCFLHVESQRVNKSTLWSLPPVA